MQESSAQESDQSSAKWKKFLIVMGIVRIVVQTQLTAVLFVPILVKIEDACNNPPTHLVQLVNAFPMKTTWGINREAALTLGQSQAESTVHRVAQFIEYIQVNALGSGTMKGLNPSHLIPAHIRLDVEVPSTSDPWAPEPPMPP